MRSAVYTFLENKEPLIVISPVTLDPRNGIPVDCMLCIQGYRLFDLEAREPFQSGVELWNTLSLTPESLENHSSKSPEELDETPAPCQPYFSFIVIYTWQYYDPK